MYIKMTDEKELVVTVDTTIYRGEQYADMIIFLVPSQHQETNIADCTMSIRYVDPCGIGHSEVLEIQPELYRGYCQYTLPVTTKLTGMAGDVTLWLTAIDARTGVVLKTGEAIVHVRESRDLIKYMEKSDLDQLDQLSIDIATIKANKADDITYHVEDSTIQLLSNGRPIGQRIDIATSHNDGGLDIVGVEINDEGELVVSYADGSQQNLGRVVGADGRDGAVYVPQVSDRKILSFVVENEPTSVPDPVDLNPSDEWSSIDNSEVTTDYVWEPM